MEPPDFLTYYYKRGTEPFRTMSTLSDDEMLAVMQSDFPEDRWFHKAPQRRIAQRRSTEQWLRQEFIKQGGRPKLNYPLYMVLGRSSFIAEYSGFGGSYCTIQIPIVEFTASELSFTYPDSVVSKWLADSQHILYNSAYHGRVFSLSEILDLVAKYNITGNEWCDQPERKHDIFVEAQIWNDAPLQKYR